MSAQLIADKKTHNLGSVKLYSEEEVTFTLSNASDSPVTITRILASNSQVETTCSSMEIPAQGSTMLTVTTRATLGGRFTHAIFVYTDTGSQPLELHIKGRAVLNVEADKKRHEVRDTADVSYGVDYGELVFSTDNIEFDYVNDGDVVSKTIYVTNNSDTNCEPNLMLLPSYLSVQAYPAVLRPGKKGYIVVTLDSRKLNHRMGLTQDVVYASSYKGEKTSKENEIPVSVVLFDTTTVISTADAPVIELSTTELVLPPMKKRKVKGTVTITNTGHSRLDIKSLQTFHPAVNVSLPRTFIMPGETIKLKVAVVRKYLDASSASHRILMITNDYKHPVVLINVKNEEE